MLRDLLQCDRAECSPSSVPEPRVAIVLVNWNGYEVTKDCLESLRKVEYSNFYVIVVDNGSSDGSADKLESEFQEAVVLRAGRNLGFTGGNNLGMKHALDQGADYVLLLNNDTVVSPAFLAELVGAGERNGSVGMLNPKIYYYNPPDRIWYAGGEFKMWQAYARHTGARRKDTGQWNQEREVTFITGCAFLIKTGVLHRIGLLDDIFFYSCEDTDWCVRIAQAGYKGLYVPSAVIWHKESYDVKKNAGRAFRDYYNIRNGILMARKHARLYEWPSFLLFLALMLTYRTAGYLVKGQPDRVVALYRGLWSGCTTAFQRQDSLEEQCRSAQSTRP